MDELFPPAPAAGSGAAVTFGGVALGIRTDTVLIFEEDTPLGYLAYAEYLNDPRDVWDKPAVSERE